MRAVLEDVHFCRHARFPQREEIVNAIFDGHRGVGIGVKQKGRRRLSRHAYVGRQTARDSRIDGLSQQHGFRPLMRPRLRQRDHWIAEN